MSDTFDLEKFVKRYVEDTHFHEDVVVVIRNKDVRVITGTLRDACESGGMR